LLVEGNLDCIRLNSLGYNTVAQLGTTLTPHHAQLLKSYSDTVLLLYDGDDAGKKSAYSAILLLMENSVNVGVLELPDGSDPDTFILKNKELKELKTRSGLSYYCDAGLKHGNSVEQLIINCLNKIRKISDKRFSNYYVRDAAKVFGLSESSIKAELKKV